MPKRICYDCEHRILNVEDSDVVCDEPPCWKCNANYWQDESICLGCDGRHSCRGWAKRCKRFKARIF